MGGDEIRLRRTISCCARRYPRCAWTLTSGIIGFLGKVRGGDAGIEAAGGEPEHGGGDDDEAQSSHNAAILPQVRQLGKGLEYLLVLRNHDGNGAIKTEMELRIGKL